MLGELNARSPRLTMYDLTPPIASDRKTSRGRSSDSSFSSVPGGSTVSSPLSGNEPASRSNGARSKKIAAAHDLRRMISTNRPLNRRFRQTTISIARRRRAAVVPAASLNAFFERRPFEPDSGRRILQRQHQFLADRAQLLRVELPQFPHL